MGGENIRFSWRELEDTPFYVVKFCWDLLNIKRRCIAERAERNRPPGGAR
jgi:hypothetical protein